MKYGAGICQLIGFIRKPKGGNTSRSFTDLKDIQTEVQWIVCKRDYKNEHFGNFGSTFFTVKELTNSPDWKKLS